MPLPGNARGPLVPWNIILSKFKMCSSSLIRWQGIWSSLKISSSGFSSSSELCCMVFALPLMDPFLVHFSLAGNPSVKLPSCVRCAWGSFSLLIFTALVPAIMMVQSANLEPQSPCNPQNYIVSCLLEILTMGIIGSKNDKYTELEVIVWKLLRKNSYTYFKCVNPYELQL